MIRRLYVVLAALAVLVSLMPIVPALANETEPAEVEPPGGWWVDWLAAFDLNGNKIDDEAEGLALEAVSSGDPDTKIPVLATFEDFLSEAELESLLLRLDAATDAYAFRTRPVVDLDVPAGNLLDLSGEEGLVAVEYDRTLEQVLDVSAPATQANRGNSENSFYNGMTAEDLGYTGEDMVVAVLDTGVSNQHPAFSGKWIAGADVTTPVPVDCVDPVDDDGHGTHVASTAIGSFASSELFGTAKSGKLVEVKIGAAGASLGGINRGFEFVKRYNDSLAAGEGLCGPSDDHIDVATLSFGSVGRGGPNAGTTEGFVNDLVSTGVAVTIAAGNCGPQASSLCTFEDDDNGMSSPANAAGSISVANFNDVETVTRNDDVIAASSSRGPNAAGTSNGDPGAAGGATSAADLADRHRKPEVAAPGTSITAACNIPTQFLICTLSGTSMATPHVAGIAALLLEAGEDARSETGGENLMASTGNGYVGGNYVEGIYPVRDAIIHSTDYKTTDAKALWTGPNSVGLNWNNAWGYGQINAFGALCWAWDNVLGPGGASRPDAVSSVCAGGPPPPDGSPCSLNNGLLILKDFEGDQGVFGVETQPEHDVHFLRMSQPEALGGSLQFHLKMATLESLPPSTVWPVVFVDQAGVSRFVRMSTDEFGGHSFATGVGTNPNPGVNPGTTIPDSTFDTDGNIRLVVPLSMLGGPLPGDEFDSFLTRIRIPTPTGGFVSPDNMPDNLIPAGSYTIIGPDDCVPNNDPVANPDEVTTDEDSPVTVDVLANDSDPDGDPITVVGVGLPGFGTAASNVDGTVTYTPNPNANGVDNFNYTIGDGKGGSDIGTVTVTVTSLPDDPVAVDDAIETDADTPVTIDVLLNDFDVDGDLLAVVSATDPANGTVVINPNDSIAYSPDTDFTGTDTFDYEIDDGTGRTDSATVTITVNPEQCTGDSFMEDVEGELEPGWSFDTAINDSLTLINWSVVEDPLAHSLTRSFFTDDPDGKKDDRLVSPAFDVSASTELHFWHRFDMETDFDGGVLEVSTDGGVTWEDVLTAGGFFLAGGYNGLINPITDSEIAGRAAWTDVSPAWPLAMNEVVVDLGALTGETINLRWRMGADAFVSDVGWWVDDISLTNPLVECPTLPTANDDEANVERGGSVNIEVLANDSDPENDSTVTIESGPANGTATVEDDGTITYQNDGSTPDTDSFEYRITDSAGNFDTATVNITITGPPPPPEGGGKVTGSGWLATDDGGKLNFSFNAKDQGEEGLKGNLQLSDKGDGVRIHGKELTAIGSFSGECGGIGGPNSIEFRMTGEFNKGVATFRICVEDNAEPGQQSDTEKPDAFYLECLSGCDYNTDSRTPDDELDGGNIRISEAPASPEGSSAESSGTSDTSSSHSASVLILDPLLVWTADAGSVFDVTIRAYGSDGELASGVPVELVVYAGGVPTVLSGVSDPTGLVSFSLVVPAAGFDLEAKSGALTSNFVNISLI